MNKNPNPAIVLGILIATILLVAIWPKPNVSPIGRVDLEQQVLEGKPGSVFTDVIKITTSIPNITYAFQSTTKCPGARITPKGIGIGLPKGENSFGIKILDSAVHGESCNGRLEVILYDPESGKKYTVTSNVITILVK